MKELTIGKNDAGQRLDKFLKKAFPLLPDSLLYKTIRTKDIKVNGKRTDAAYKLCEGDKLYIYIHDKFLTVPDEEHAYLSVTDDISVVYEDENILLVNKPAGLVVHADENASPDTLIARIQAYLYKKGEYDPQTENSFAPALCNRIDRNTAGIVIAAKNAAALREMNEKIRDRRIDKRYLLAVHGKMTQKSGTLKNYLRKDANENKVYIEKQKTPQNVTAITRYRVLAESGNYTLLEAEILTGRTHQIRAQFAHIGHPLLGDTKYGTAKQNRETGYRYQTLFAYKLTFPADEKAETLSYLNGKTFRITDVPFLELFDLSLSAL